MREDPVRYSVRVGYGDTDQGGVVHHSVYLRWLEQARIEWLRVHGLDYRSLEYNRKLALPVVEAHLRYRMPARFDEVLEVECALGKLGRASMRFDYRVLRGDDVLTEAQITLACIELPAGKLRSLGVVGETLRREAEARNEPVISAILGPGVGMPVAFREVLGERIAGSYVGISHERSAHGHRGNGMAATAEAREAGGEGGEADPIAELVRGGAHREAIALCATMHGAALGRLCMAMLGSQGEAEETVQEALVAAHAAMGSWRGEGPVRAFVFSIARRMCARRIETRVRRDRRLRLVHDAGEEAALPDDVLERRRRAQRVREALDQLKPSEREAVVLRYEGGLAYREIAAVCGIDEAAARKRTSRALMRLRTLLDGDLR